MPATANPTAQLVARHLTFGYEPGQPILRDLSACLQGGELCALVGPNAAGKSTLLRLLIGQYRPWEGSVQLDHQNVAQLATRQRAQRISYVPQRATASFAFTVQEVIAMGRHASTPDPTAVQHAIESCGLSELRSRVYNQLSTGQQQRVLLARAVAQATGTGRVMLLDEPGSAMDLWHIHRMMQTLLSIARSGLAVLVVLHDPNLAVRYADTAWAMNQGQLVASGPWHSVLCPDILEPLYRIRLRTMTCEEDRRPIFAFEPSDTEA